MSAQCSAVAAATAAAAGAVLGLGVARVFSPVASLTDAPPPCQAQLYLVAQLEPTRVRWKGDQVHTTRNKEANVQECNGVKSVYDSTERETDSFRVTMCTCMHQKLAMTLPDAATNTSLDLAAIVTIAAYSWTSA